MVEAGKKVARSNRSLANRQFYVNLAVAAFSLGLSIVSVVMMFRFQSQNDKVMQALGIKVDTAVGLSAEQRHLTKQLLDRPFIVGVSDDIWKPYELPSRSLTAKEETELLRVYASGDIDRAALMTQGFHQQLKESATLSLVSGLVETARGRREIAKHYLDEAVRLSPASLDARLARGEINYQMSEYRAAASDFETALKLVSGRHESAAVSYRAGVAHRHALAYGAALERLQAAVRLSSDSTKYVSALAELQLQLGYDLAAESLTSRALTMDPNDAQSLATRARLLASRGLTDKAVAAYDTALLRTPRNAQLWLECGNLLLRCNRPKAAVRYLNACISLNFRNPDACVSLAEAILESKGDAWEAVMHLDNALDYPERFSDQSGGIRKARELRRRAEVLSDRKWMTLPGTIHLSLPESLEMLNKGSLSE